jgi:hypothetical protein
MSEQQIGFLLMILPSSLILFIGVVTGGLGYWARARNPKLYWGTMVVFGTWLFAGAYRLIAG